MIIARGATAHQTELLILGLSKENVTRLQQGKPILITRATHGEGVPPGWQIAIMYGETELAMRRELEATGALGPETKIHIDPRLQT